MTQCHPGHQNRAVLGHRSEASKLHSQLIFKYLQPWGWHRLCTQKCPLPLQTTGTERLGSEEQGEPPAWGGLLDGFTKGQEPLWLQTPGMGLGNRGKAGADAQ